jgi:hypothetical protein
LAAGAAQPAVDHAAIGTGTQAAALTLEDPTGGKGPRRKEDIEETEDDHKKGPKKDVEKAEDDHKKGPKKDVEKAEDDHKKGPKKDVEKAEDDHKKGPKKDDEKAEDDREKGPKKDDVDLAAIAAILESVVLPDLAVQAAAEPPESGVQPTPSPSPTESLPSPRP